MKLQPEQMEEILKSIKLTGAVLPKFKEINHIFQPKNFNLVLNLNSGLPKIRKDMIPKFDLILEAPKAISAIPRHEFKCFLCGQVISFPVWYFLKSYNVNQMHHFICFDPASPLQVTAKCFRRR